MNCEHKSFLIHSRSPPLSIYNVVNLRVNESADEECNIPVFVASCTHGVYIDILFVGAWAE